MADLIGTRTLLGERAFSRLQTKTVVIVTAWNEVAYWCLQTLIRSGAKRVVVFNADSVLKTPLPKFTKPTPIEGLEVILNDVKIEKKKEQVSIKKLEEIKKSLTEEEDLLILDTLRPNEDEFHTCPLKLGLITKARRQKWNCLTILTHSQFEETKELDLNKITGEVNLLLKENLINIWRLPRWNHGKWGIIALTGNPENEGYLPFGLALASAAISTL